MGEFLAEGAHPGQVLIQLAEFSLEECADVLTGEPWGGRGQQPDRLVIANRLKEATERWKSPGFLPCP